jgi:ATP adenylyltransferase
MFEPGRLWPTIVDRTRNALSTGALLPIRTRATFIADGGVGFMVRVAESLRRKDEDRQRRMHEGRADKGSTPFNPFLPHEPDMFVADISDTHLCLLNKFNVIDHHLLIVTRAFEDQEMLLTLRDFQAICACMSEFDALAFYNGGETAGASQAHKHLQMIPLPMADRGPRVPIESLMDADRLRDGFGALPALRFVHGISPLDLSSVKCPRDAAKLALDLYRDMLARVGLNPVSDPALPEKQSAPYNLLFTRQWMLLVPRSREHFESISINAIGFAGAHLVRNQQQMQALRQHGPMAALEQTAIEVI